MEPSPVALCGTLDIQPGNVDALRAFLTHEARVVRANEPGTIDFCFFVDPTGTELRWFESYIDSTSFATHMQNLQAREFLSRLHQYGGLRCLDVFGAVDPIAHGILEALDARFWDRVAGFDRSVGHILTR